MSVELSPTKIRESPSTSYISPYIEQYKTPGRKYTQNQRRYEILQAIKQKRHSELDEKRKINEFIQEDDNSFDNLEESDQAMDISTLGKQKKRRKKFANKLMLSEWMVEKPNDLEDKWLLKICPIGGRNLIVAHKGITKCFKKSGHFVKQFQSQLPGGSSSASPPKLTILDCIYCEKDTTFYVLDVLVWNSFSVLNSPTEFRFFFLQSKLEETPCAEVSKGNKYKFAYIPHHTPDPCTLETLFCDYNEDIDGVLFYHSEINYLSEVTPLVGWLKVFMMPEILSVPVHSQFMLEKSNYKTIYEYMDNFMKEHKIKMRNKKQLRDVEMGDCEEEEIEVEEEQSREIDEEMTEDM